MNVTETIETLEANGLDYDGKLAEMGVSGYASDGCQELAEGCLALIGDYCRAGVNGGFNASMKDAIKRLSHLCVVLSDKKADKKLKKYEQAKADIVSEVKLTEKGGKNMSIKEEVFKYIDTSVQACDVIKGMNVAADRAGILRESKKKFALLRAKVEEAMDDSSKSAAEVARKIVNCILGWRKDASIFMHTEATLALLDKAIALADEWVALRESVKSGGLFSRDKRAKEEDIVKYKTDEIDRIAASISISERIGIFQENLKKYEEGQSSRYDTAADKEEQKECSARIEELKGRKRALIDAVRNGEADKVEAMLTCKDEIDPEIADLEEEVKRLSSEISKKTQMRREYRRVYRKLSAINEFIMSYRNDPAMLYTLGWAIDFNMMNNVMRGMANAAEIDHVVNLELANKYVDNRVREQLGMLRTRLDEAEEEIEGDFLAKKHGVRLSPEEVLREEKKQRAKEEEEADKYFAEFDLESPAPAPAQQEEVPQRISLSDDDK